MVQVEEGFVIAELGRGAYVVVARGDLDIATAARLHDAFESAEARGARRLVADLTAVTFMDSAGLTVLVNWAKRVRARDGDFVVVTDDPRIVRVFEITGFDAVVRLERSLVEAVNELVARSAVV